MGILLCIISVLSIIVAEAYLYLLTYLVKRFGIKADIPRILVAIVFLALLAIMAFILLKVSSVEGFGSGFSILLFLPLWNFATYIALNWKRGKIALGAIRE